VAERRGRNLPKYGLEARLANARNTERRLTELLKERTGKLSDVLAVENEHARVRGEIERMEAEKRTCQTRWPSLPYQSMVDGIVSFALFLLEDGPSLILWGAVLFLPARLIWKRVRRSFAH